MNRRAALPTIAALALVPALAIGATFQATYSDGPSEGFNDPSAPQPESQSAGNPGMTLGEQRQWAFEQAFDWWDARLQSSVVIKVDAQMNDLACNSSSATLGSAGTTAIFRNWSPHPPVFANTWYGQALANRIRQSDLCNASCASSQGIPDEDIDAEFNKDVDNNNSCLNGVDWFYGLGEAPPGFISFYRTVLHEIGHGVNFQTFVDITNGTKMSGFDDVFMKFLEDHSTGESWPQMTNAERQASATDTGDLHWAGPQVLAAINSVTSGAAKGHVEMYAPGAIMKGSSVSHWDTSLADAGGHSEFMEPFATGAEKDMLTDEALEDIGWSEFSACGGLQDEVLLQSTTVTGSQSYSACRYLILGNGFVIDPTGDVQATGGYGVALRPGFEIKSGGAFTAGTDTSLGEF